MKKHTENSPRRKRGRPRKPENTALIAALIERQDAMAQRTDRKIRAILDTHIPLHLAELAWARMCHLARTRLERIPDDYVARHPEVVGRAPAVREVLRQLTREALTELADELEHPPTTEEIAEERALVVADPVLRRPRVVIRSHTLAAARAQSARLASQLIALKERIVRLPAGWPRRTARVAGEAPQPDREIGEPEETTR